MRILFTGVGRRVELVQAFRNAALVLNKELKIYGADMSGTAPALVYCDYARHTVSMRDPGYIDNLLSICFDDHIDLVIPTIDTDLLVLAENKNRFESIGTKVLISDPDKIRICRDKNNTSRFFLECGLHAPSPVNDWKEYKSGYPAFIKPKDGSSSINAFKVEDKEKLEVYAKQIPDYIVQPFIDGMEYTIDVFCDWKGEPISVVPREREQVRAGEVLKTRICMDEVMIAEAKKLCRVFRPCGPITVQLIRDKMGVDWYIEINPRFGGGAPLSMKAGARSAESILKLLDGEDTYYYNTVSDGAIYSRFDQSVCITEGKSKVKGVIFDLDDTLYSEKEYVYSGYRAVATYLESNDYADELWHFFIDGKPAIDELLKRIGREKEKGKCIGVYRDHFPDIHLYDDVAQLLEILKKNNIKVGIITDGRPKGQRNKITALGLEEIVDDIIITDELGGIQFRKPCDIAFRIMLTRWKLNSSDVMYIGDNIEKDLSAPRQLGMQTLLLRNTQGIYFNEGESINYPVVNNFSEMTNYIKGRV